MSIFDVPHPIEITGCNLENDMFIQQWRKTPLHYAVAQQNADTVTALLNAGSKVDEKDLVSCMLDCMRLNCVYSMHV